MVRGVNKRIIELSDVNNDCFERILLIVNEKNTIYSDNELQRMANDYILEIKPTLRLKKSYVHSRYKTLSFLKYLLSALIGGIVTFSAYLLLSGILNFSFI